MRSLFLALILMCLIVNPSLAQQSTSGPNPPPEMDPGHQNSTRSQVVLSGVPAYIWHHGCGPTAIGMVIGYWDGNGCAELVPGDAAIQTDEVNNMIADDDQNPSCSGSSSNHYQDYCCPIDYYPDLFPDLSETGGAHSGNCVADFMEASWSSRNNRYGWSWYSDVPDAFIDYVNLVAPEYAPTAFNRTYSNFSFASFRTEIDNGRPVVLLVDSDGDGGTDHFVAAIGYDNADKEYACLNTWDANIHWYPWREISSGYSYGIYGATIFNVTVPDCIDLTPSTFYLDSVQAVYPGESIQNRLHAVVGNIGNTMADSSTVSFYISTNNIISIFDQLLTDGNERIGMISSHDSSLVTINGSLSIPENWPAGPAYLGIIVDRELELSECDETNNTAFIPIIVSDSGDYMAEISGHIYYYDSIKPIAGVEIDMSPIVSSPQTTDAEGYFKFGNLIPDNYTLGATRTDNDAGVSVADIIKIRRHLAQLEIFDTPYKLVAADVNLSGTVSVADIIKTRRYLAQLEDLQAGNWIFIDSAFTINDSNWSIAPQSVVVPLSGTDIDKVSFIGMRVGDVNNTWGQTKAAKPLFSAAATIHIGRASGTAGEKIIIPVSIENSIELAGVELHFSYDASRLNLIKIISNLPGDLTLNDTRGTLHIVWEDIYITLLTSNNQTLVDLQFEILPGLTDQTDIELAHAELVDNFGSPYRLEIKQGRVTCASTPTLPKEISLEQNHPNPFNPLTGISFGLPFASDVRLDIYNIMGQRVATLADGPFEAGRHSCFWDGSDVASGIYFYRLQAEGFDATRKMILLK